MSSGCHLFVTFHYPLPVIRRFLSALGACALLAISAPAQTPTAYFPFDNNTTEGSGSGITITPSAGFTPTYAADRNNIASRAIVFTGGQSLQLVSSLAGNSNQTLGLRNAGGTNTSFTLSAWVYFTSSGSGQGYSTIFGNLGSGAGTLHAGLGSDSANVHFGFDGSDVNGATVGVSNNVWYHVTYVYDTTPTTSGGGTAPSQRIYINGVPEVTRWGVTNTLKVADLYLGNWSTANSTTNDLKARLDDVAIYNTALKADQIQALANGVSPTALPAAGTYSGPRRPGVFGTAGKWGIREIKAYPSISTGTLVNADRIINAYGTTPGGTVANYLASVINFNDPEGAGNLGYFVGETTFGTNTAGADDNYLMVARCGIRIPTTGDYTFGFRGDDGSRLRILGKQFASSTRVTAGPADPAHNGDGLYFVNGTGDSNTLGVVNLPAGDYALEFVWWEGTGGSSVEVYAAPGSKTSVDSTFQLIGNTANGGLEIVRDPITVPTFTADGGNSAFIHNGSPANVTLAWSVTNPTTTLALSPGGAVAASGNQMVAPAVTTTYTLTATTPLAVGTDANPRSVTVYVNSAPIIGSLTASDTTVTSGTGVTLNWTVEGATSLVLQPGNIDVTGQTSRVVSPTADTTYTLFATNPSGTSQQAIAIDVGTAPVINSFVVSDTQPLYNRDLTLTWATTNADSVSINQGVGPISGASGTVLVPAFQSTTFTLTAVNIYGQTTDTESITVSTPIGLNGTGFTVTRFNSTLAFPYAGMGYLQSADALIAGTNLAASTTVNNVASINYADGNDGDFGSNASFPALGGGQGNNHFAIRAVGTLNVNTPGEFFFILNSDDGGRLRIDGQDVIVDDATHSPSANSGKVTITKPQVSIELVYYDATGNGQVELGWIRPNLSWQLLGTTALVSGPTVNGVRISEFMAENDDTLVDEDGDHSDWIEIWNSTGSTLNLSTYFLTDDPALPNKWAFPAWTLGSNKYLVVFASQKDRTPAQAVAGQDNAGTLAQPRLHTNFNLSNNGEYLALTKSNGMGGYTTVHEFSPTYPEQSGDVSYGISEGDAYVGYMETPTPGFTNAVTYTGFVGDTVFSVQRGRYSAPFNLTLSTATVGATIRYTLDGSIPTMNTGLVYSSPINIANTKVVRAAAFKAGWKSSNVDTKSYLFVDDVVTQDVNHAVALGFPAGAVNGQSFRYGMSVANVTAGGGNLQALKNALSAAPSVFLSTDVGNLVSPTTGIYTHPDQRGLEWERPASMEMINAAGTSEFQIDCGIRIRGGASRSYGNSKHAFHAYFRGLYDGNLKYRLFGSTGAREFNQIDLRCEQNYSWSKDGSNQNSLIREEWSRLTQRDMDQPYARHGFYHLYINGVYWGIFNWEERTEADFGESYFGGSKDNWDTVKSAGSSGGYDTEMTDGNFAAWHSLYTQAIALKNDATEVGRTAKLMQMMGKNPDGTPNASYPVLLDIENLADYQLVIFYDGSFDAPMSTFLSNASNNWFGIRDRAGNRGFAFFAHDNEHGMDSTGTNSYNRIGPWGGSGNNNWGQGQYNSRETMSNGYYSKSNPHYLHELLCFSAEYRTRFADRVHRHFFNAGALTTVKSVARVTELANQIDPIIHAEAARWGSTGLHKNTWANTAKATVLNFVNNGGAIPGGHPALTAGDRTSIVLQLLKGYQEPVGTSKALYPAILAPTFSGQFGGNVASGYAFNITNPNGTGTLYYTKNGSDPRAIGGGVTAGALTGASPIPVTLTDTGTIKARVFNNATSTWSAMTEAEFIVGVPASATNIAISQLHYNPASSDDLTEFIEVMNVGATNVDLTNCRFAFGVEFTFPAGFVLAPGARGLVVADLAAFTAAYPTVPAAKIAGTFQLGTGLNNTLEQIQLVTPTNDIIRDFTYRDSGLWPKSPDGDGPSLVLKRPLSTPIPDHDEPLNWRPSYAIGGTPGVSDETTYAAWATQNTVGAAADDFDLDGLSNFLEYALGSNPRVPSAGVLPVGSIKPISVSNVIGNYLTLTYTRSIGRDDATYFVEGQTDITAISWTAAVQVGNPVFNENGTETLTFRYPTPISAADTRQFLRLRVVQLP